MQKNVLWGALLCLIASASWGAMFPVANHAFQYIDPFWFTIVRYVPVSLILIIALLLVEGKKAFKLEGNGLVLWFFGTMGFVVYNLLIFVGQDLLGEPGVLLASIMEALAPILSVFVLWIIHKNSPKWVTLISIIGAFIGVFLVVSNGNLGLLVGENRLFPLFLLLLAALGWACYTIGGGHFPRWSVLRYSTLSCLYGTLTASIVVIIGSMMGFIEVPTMTVLYHVRYDMLFMIFVPGLIALIGWNKGVSILKPINAILFINFAPVTTLIIQLIQGHRITMYEFIGVTLVCSMIIANNIYQRMDANRTRLPKKSRIALQSSN
ncbi:DMT family transporter [Virgibacillus sp. W0181]|uniref:DMT family transporter n=1 Tax=Virgibacillus sp. W0181 TaxID=3391581 RepID=UPI003F4486C3